MNECLDIYYTKQLVKTIEASTLSEQEVFYGWPSICVIDFSKLFTASTEIYHHEQRQHRQATEW